MLIALQGKVRCERRLQGGAAAVGESDLGGGGSHLYVNRGFGSAGPPMQSGAPPEVTKLVLVSA